MGLEPAAMDRVVPVDGAEIEVDRRGSQAGPAAEALQGRFGILAHLGWTQVLAVFDDRQLELVELQFRDLAKGLLQRLPREAECAASDEHRPLLSFPVLSVGGDLQPDTQRPDRRRGRLGLRARIPCSGLLERSYRSLRSGDRAEAAAGPGRPGLAVSDSSEGRFSRFVARMLGWRAQCELDRRANSA